MNPNPPSFPFKTVLVTGAAGFIGNHLSERLLKEGAHVTGVDNLNDYYDVGLKKDRLRRLESFENFSLIRTNLEDKNQLEEIFKRTAFDVVVSGDSFPVKKPNPHSVLDCLTRWGIATSDALFVGDSSIDAATARNAGVEVWLLPYGYNMGESVQACAPDRVIADFSALLSIESAARHPSQQAAP